MKREMDGAVADFSALRVAGCHLAKFGVLQLVLAPLVLTLEAATAWAMPRTVALELDCDACGASAAELRGLRAWLLNGLKQSGYPAAHNSLEATETIRAKLGLTRWRVSLASQPGGAALDVVDFRVASIEIFHLMVSLLEEQRGEPVPPPIRSEPAAAQPEGELTAAPSPSGLTSGADFPTAQPVMVERDASDTATDHGPRPSHDHWSIQPRVHAGVLWVDLKPRVAVGLGAHLLRFGDFGLGVDLQYAAGTVLPSLTVQDYAVRLNPFWGLLATEDFELELGAWLGLVNHRVSYRESESFWLWQSVLGVPAVASWHTGLAELGVRVYLQLSPAGEALADLRREPYQFGLDMLVDLGQW